MTYYLLKQLTPEAPIYTYIVAVNNKVFQCIPNWYKSTSQALSKQLSTHKVRSGNWSPLNEVLAEYQTLASSNKPITQQTHPEFFI